MSALGEAYHNTTAHYNGYFNANELLIASEALLQQAHIDNYTQLLPMYPELAVEDASVIAPDADNAIEKVTVVVNLHPYSKWVDDCYLLFGKAQYLKRNYEAAEEAFRYFSTEFSPEAMEQKEKKAAAAKKSSKKKKKSKKRKQSKRKKNKLSKKKSQALKKYNKAVRKARKSGGAAPEKPEILRSGRDGAAESAKEEKRKANEEELKEEQAAEDGPDDNPLKHRPAYQEGMLYYAKTLIERDKFDQAQRILTELLESAKTYKDIRAELSAVQAYLFIQTEDYAQAVAALEQAIELQKDKQRKARYAFIMGQLYQKLGNSRGAYAGFEQALAYKPDYTMAFNCQLNLAKNAWASGQGGALQARQELERMLKEEKNAEFKDQIYFTLAEVAFAENDRAEGIRNLQRSLQHSLGNSPQKTEAYLLLADLYFEDESYVEAKLYYDSTLMAMVQADERYKRVKGAAENLTDIADNLQIIALQDSLLRISQMSPKEQEALALRIKKERDEERRKQLLQQANRQSTQRFNTLNNRINTGGALAEPSTFFAYDDRRLKRGEREFDRKWGNRALEDNWRRSAVTSDALLEDLLADSGSPDILTEEEVQKLLGDVPRTEADIRTAELKIQEAMSKLGPLYRERLEKYDKAIEILEALNRRFPSNNFELESWYQLYLAYQEVGNTAKAKEYADKILDKYTGTTYAMLIKDPNYGDEIAAESQRLTRYYDETYQAFQTGNYQQAYSRSLGAKEEFGAGNPMQAKFALLAAMSAGNIEGKEAYIEQLRNVVARFPDTEEQLRAREILRLLGETTASLPAGAKEEIENFKYEEDKLHYFIIAFSSQDLNLNDAKVQVSDYNEKYHKLDRIRISNIYLGTDAKNRVPILVLRRFKNKQEAMAYYQGVVSKKGEFITDEAVEFELFPVTQDNYREVLKERTLDSYRIFFQQYYLN